MTQQEIKEIYRKQRRAFAQRKYYYKKKYGIELETPTLVKNPTEKTLERYAKNVYQQTEKLKKRVHKKDKRNVPTAEEILLDRINKIINEGLRSDNSFERYKSDKIQEMILESLPANKKQRIAKLQEWDKKLPQLDSAIDTFIFDSSQTDKETKNHSTVLYNTISSVLLGTKPVFTEEYIDD